MKVAHIGTCEIPVYHRLGGAIQRRIREIAQIQSARGDNVLVYSAGSAYHADWQQGSEHRTIACRLPRPSRDFEFLGRVLRDLTAFRPDVIHFHAVPEGAALARCFGLRAKTFLSYDYFVFRHGTATPLFHLYRKALGMFSVLLPVSHFCRVKSVEYWSIGKERIEVLYNGVNVHQFRPDPPAGRAMRATLGLGSAPVILYVGRVCEQKGTDVLLQAYSRV